MMITERERERESILAYFQRHNIRSVRLENDSLIIEYNNSRTETKSVTTNELQQIRSYCQAKGVTSLSLTDLQKQSNNTQQPTNYLPYILGGIGIIAVVGMIAYFSLRKKRK